MTAEEKELHSELAYIEAEEREEIARAMRMENRRLDIISVAAELIGRLPKSAKKRRLLIELVQGECWIRYGFSPSFDEVESAIY